jgi:hypothetical protein
MNKKLLSILTIFGLMLLTVPVLCQDSLIMQDNRRIECRISRMTEDSVFYTLNIKGKSISTANPLSNFRDYHFYIIGQIQNDYDSSAFYTLILKEKIILFGKIKSIEKSKIIIDDQVLDEVSVRAELIKTYEKETLGLYYQVTLINGQEVKGQMLQRRKSGIDLETENLGIVSISNPEIKSMKVIEQKNVRGGQYWFTNPNNTRYFFAPSAMNLRKGEGYYQNSYILANSVNYGLTNYFSIGGMVVLPIAALLTPKIGFRITERLHMGAGCIVGILPDPSVAGIAYGLATYGTMEHNLTLGSGVFFFEGELTNRPIFTLNGMTRISRRLALVTENWAVPLSRYTYENGVEGTEDYYYYAISYGLRLMSERITFDFALVNSKDIVDFLVIGVPYIDFVYKF